jgi:hypothetical protein
MSDALRVEWFDRDPVGGTLHPAPTETPIGDAAGFEYCTVCDDLTEIALRSSDQRICYHCADDAE